MFKIKKLYELIKDLTRDKLYASMITDSNFYGEIVIKFKEGKRVEITINDITR